MSWTSEFDGTWDYGELPSNVVLGEGVWLESRQTFERFRSRRDPGLVIGNGVRVYTWTRLSIEPTGFLEIGEGCVLVGAMFMGAGRIRLGPRVAISYGVTIADCDFHPMDPVRRRSDAIAHAPFGDEDDRQPFEPRPVEISEDVRIGVGAIVLKGVRVGAGARIGPGAVVTRDVPPGVLVEGNPARVVDRQSL